jgi:hypothetical protein
MPATRDLIRNSDTVGVPPHGGIAPPMWLFLRRAQKAGARAGAASIVILTEHRCRPSIRAGNPCARLALIATYTFVNGEADSAGALIASRTGTSRSRSAPRPSSRLANTYPPPRAIKRCRTAASDS